MVQTLEGSHLGYLRTYIIIKPTQNKTMRYINVIICISFFACSCVQKNINKQIDIHSATQREANLHLQAQVFKKEKKSMRWSQALRLAKLQNPNYTDSLLTIERATKEKKEQWHELIPNFYLFANLNKPISEISDLSSDDIEFNIVSNIKIPNPIKYYARAYSYGLQELQAIWNHELQERYLNAELYRYFLSYQAIEAKEADILFTLSNIDTTPVKKIPQTLSSIQRTQLQLVQSKERMRTRLNQFFNSPGENWRLVGPPPKISYETQLDRLDFTKGFGALGTKLQTIKIESSIIQLWQAKYRRWPMFNVGMSTPEIYNKESDTAFDYPTDDFKLFTGLSKSIKPYDIMEKDLLTNAELRAAKNRQLLLRQMESEISQLELNKLTYKQYLNKKKRIESELSRVSSTKPSGFSMIDDAKSFVSLTKELESINAQLTQIDLQFWIWDEVYWN